MAVQGVLTVVAEIQPDRVEALVAVLDTLDAALWDGAPAPLVNFAALGSVHFARFAVLPADSRGRRMLAFSTAYDGPRRFHLTELAKRVAEGLCTIYDHCVGFPERAHSAPATLLAYLEAHVVRYGAAHVGYVGRTVEDVRAEEALRRFVGNALDASRTSTIPSPGRTAQRVRDDVILLVTNSEYRWAVEPRKARIAPSGVEGYWHNAAVLSGVVGAIVAGGVVATVTGHGISYAALLVGAAGLVVATLRWHETHEPAKEDTNIAQGLEHAEDEDFGVRNQLTHLVDVKPGRFRLNLLRFVLFAVEIRARLEFYKGDLGGIETIHCAHWAILGGEKPRLLFISNYDGSWERYLGDFIEEAGGGMTSVWSNTVDYPRASFLLWDGAANERVFKAWTREKQVRTQVWYAAHPDVSSKNLNDNSRLRDGLRGFMTEEEAREWLRLL